MKSALKHIMSVEKGENHIHLYMWNDMGTMCLPVALICHTLPYCNNTYVLLKHHSSRCDKYFRMDDVKDWGKGVVLSAEIGHF